MKKLISVLLVIAMTVTLSLTVLASEGVDNSDKVTTVIYQVDPTYTVTIPSGVTDSTATISIDAAPVIGETEKVVVSIGASASYDNGFRLKEANHEAYIRYTVLDGERSLDIGDTVIEQAAAAEGEASVTLTFVHESALYSGSYSDTITFIIAVLDTATD